MTRAIQPVTVEEFVLRVQDGQKADLLDGVICMASPDRGDAADLNPFLSSLTNVFVRKHPGTSSDHLSRVHTRRPVLPLDDAPETNGGPF